MQLLRLVLGILRTTRRHLAAPMQHATHTSYGNTRGQPCVARARVWPAVWLRARRAPLIPPSLPVFQHVRQNSGRRIFTEKFSCHSGYVEFGGYGYGSVQASNVQVNGKHLEAGPPLSRTPQSGMPMLWRGTGFAARGAGRDFHPCRSLYGTPSSALASRTTSRAGALTDGVVSWLT